MDWLFVGLGNPGERYAETRHNIGWMVAAAFAQKHNTAKSGTPFAKGKGAWHEARCSLHGNDVLVILPTTYMNASGEAANHARALFKTPTSRIVALVDEYNFPVGRIHLKNSGSSGGHNGTASMLEKLGSPTFLRLRCGIDKHFGPGELVDYVLKPFADDELAKRDAMIQDGVRALETLIELGTARAMATVNAWKPA
jgi:peptidyl-tRNA hydrolase, PTH1 family